MRRILLFITAICLAVMTVNAQGIFQFKEIDQPQNEELSKKILNYQVFEFDTKELFQYRQQFEDELSINLVLGNKQAHYFSLQTKEIRSNDYILQTTEDGRSKVLDKNITATFQGELLGEDYGSANMTIDENFVMGVWQENGAEYFLEPLWRLLPEAPRNQYILYENKAVVFPQDFCGADVPTLAEKSKEIPTGTEKIAGECLEVEVALAADFEMVQALGSVASVESFMLGVLANVQTNYDDEFADELRFEVVTVFIASSDANDPWTNNTNAGTLLDDFVDWGNGGGFGGVSYDIASIWTDRNFQGSTIGVAYVGVVCTGLRYSAMERFSNNASLLRVVWAHEIGHNFDGLHDSTTGFIMSPSVNNTTTWSGASITRINNHVASRSCLDPCPINGGDPPIADFSFSPETGCAPLEVDFFDESTGGAPDFWEWTFPGADPDFSDEQNPTVTYFDGGTYDVTLYVENAEGDDTYSESGVITVLELPIPEFSVTIDGFIADFFNTSSNADGYEWEFGDGGFSDQSDPIYTYTEPGEYDVVLTAFNDCGSKSFSLTVVIESLLEAAFIAINADGCETLEVEFFDDSQGSPTMWEWEFPGGVPEFSSEPNPVVLYPIAGTYDVSLTVSNDSETDIVTTTSIVNVFPLPVADFDMVSTEGSGVVNFTNQSTNGDSWSWDFGDETTSIEENPSHTYTEEGTYTVTLTTTNACGSDTEEQVVVITFLPVSSIGVSSSTGCAPMTVTYMASPQGAAYTYAWTFPGGDPSTSSEANPSVTYTTAGSYDATLIVTNAAGSTTVTEENAVVVGSGPIANFDIENTVGSGVVNFTNQSTNGDSWSWDFGDETTSIEENPSHTYTEEGTYTVTLTTTNTCGSDMHIIEVVIIFPPSPSIIMSATEGCVPLIVSFQASPIGEGYTYSWVFPGGNPAVSSSATPEVTFSTAGSYEVSLTVTNSAGENTTTETITVLEQPIAAFTFDVNGLTANFQNTSTNATTYGWNIGGTVTDETSPSFTFPSIGEYEVTLVASNSCGSDGVTATVAIEGQIPSLGVTAQNNEGCGPLVVSFESEIENADDFLWIFDGGEPATSTEANPVVTYNEPGVYNVTLTASNVYGSNALTQMDIVVVHEPTVANFDYTLDGATVNLQSTSTGVNSLEWQFPDGAMSNDGNTSFTFSGNGTYDVILMVDGNCNSDVITQTIVINGLVSLPVFSMDSDKGCAPFIVTFTDESTESPTSWEWTFPGGNPETSTDQNVVVTYAVPGVYDVFLSASNEFGGSQIGNLDAVTVEDVPEVPSFTMTNVDGMSIDLAVDDPIVDYTYNWNFGDDETASGEMASHTYTETDTYLVSLTVINNCGEAIATKEVDIIVNSIDTPAWASSLSLFPNPTNGDVKIEAKGWSGSGEIDITLINVLGQFVERQQINVLAGQWSYSFDWNHLPAGTYMMQLNWGSEVWTQKLVVL